MMTHMQHGSHNRPPYGKQQPGQPQQASRPARLPRNPDNAMQEMMNTIDRIRSVYQRETEVLEAADMNGFIALQEEKFQAAELYQNDIEEIMARKSEMAKAKPEFKAQLQAMQAEFAELTQKNMDALSRMSRIMERLGGKVRDAAREEAQRQRSFSYGETGYLEHDERKAISTGISETA